MMAYMVQLPPISPSVAHAMNALVGKRWSLSVSCDAKDGADRQPIDITLGVPASLTVETPRLAVTICSRFGHFILSSGVELWNALSDRVLAGWRNDPPGTLDATWRAVLALTRLAQNAGLHQALESLDSAFCTASEARPAALSSLSGMAHLNDETFAFELTFISVPVAAWEAFAGLPPVVPSLQIDPGFPLTLCLPVRAISVHDYRALDVNDVLLTTQAFTEAFFIAGCIPQILRFSGTLCAGGSVRIAQVDLVQTDHLNMTDPADAEPENKVVVDGPLLGEDAISALPVKIDVHLKSQRLSLAELSKFAPGYTLDLHIDLTTPVTILANGATIGSGYLVQLGDHIGVQIDRWPTPKVPRDA